MLPNPVIILPGITATYLNDEYPLPPDNVWAVINKDYDRAALHPDDLRYERAEPARVVPGQIYEVCYRELTEELRHNLRHSPDQPVPVYLFGYDWRQKLEQTEERLAAYVDEVIARTRLLRHYDKDAWSDNPKVNLVGHSMGGLVITGYLERYGKSSKVGKVVTLATPFDGSLEAVVKVTTGNADLGTSPPSSREREVSRMTPALYYLMPGFSEGISFPKNMGQSLFNPDVWQPSILKTIKQYIDQYGLNRKDTTAQSKELFADLLGSARHHRERIKGFSLKTAGLTNDDWLCVAGVGSQTRVKLTIAMSGPSPVFEFHSSDRVDEWENGSYATGDSTVPLRGAIPAFLKPENIVCVTPDDFGTWEMIDKTFAKTQGFHGFIPAMDMLHRLIVRHFTGRPDPHNSTWGRKLPDIGKWSPPLSLTPPPN